MSEFENSVINPLKESLISKLGFGFDPEDDPNGVYKGMRSENYCLVCQFSTEEENVGIGFWHGNDKQFSSSQKKNFYKIMDQPEFTTNFSDYLDWGEQWIIKNLECKGWKPNDIIDNILLRFQLIEFAVNVQEIN
jgi:hypothetical protein